MRAVETLERALDHDPKSFTAKEFLALSYQLKDDHDEAADILKELVKEHPTATILRRYGAVLERQGKYCDALEYYNDAQSKQPDDDSTRLAISRTYRTLASIAWEDERYEDVASVITYDLDQIESTIAYLYRGASYVRLADRGRKGYEYQDAVEDFERALALGSAEVMRRGLRDSARLGLIHSQLFSGSTDNASASASAFLEDLTQRLDDENEANLPRAYYRRANANLYLAELSDRDYSATEQDYRQAIDLARDQSAGGLLYNSAYLGLLEALLLGGKHPEVVDTAGPLLQTFAEQEPTPLKMHEAAGHLLRLVALIELDREYEEYEEEVRAIEAIVVDEGYTARGWSAKLLQRYIERSATMEETDKENGSRLDRTNVSDDVARSCVGV